MKKNTIIFLIIPLLLFPACTPIDYQSDENFKVNGPISEHEYTVLINETIGSLSGDIIEVLDLQKKVKNGEIDINTAKNVIDKAYERTDGCVEKLNAVKEPYGKEEHKAALLTSITEMKLVLKKINDNISEKPNKEEIEKDMDQVSNLFTTIQASDI